MIFREPEINGDSFAVTDWAREGIVIAQRPVSLRKRALAILRRRDWRGQNPWMLRFFLWVVGHILLVSSLSQAFSLPFLQLTWRAPLCPPCFVVYLLQEGVVEEVQNMSCYEHDSKNRFQPLMVVCIPNHKNNQKAFRVP